MRASQTPKTTGIQTFQTSSATTRRRKNCPDPPALRRIPLKTCANSPPQAPLLNLVLDPEAKDLKLDNDHQATPLVKKQLQMPGGENKSDDAVTHDGTSRSDHPDETQDGNENANEHENTNDSTRIDLKALDDSTLKVLDSILETNLQSQVASPSSTFTSRASRDISCVSLMDDDTDEEEDDENRYNSPRCRSQSIVSSESDLVSYGTYSTTSSDGGDGGISHDDGSRKNNTKEEEDEYSFLMSDGGSDDKLGTDEDKDHGNKIGHSKHRIMLDKSGLDDESLSEILDSGSSYCETENNGNVSMVLESSFFSEGVEVSHDDDHEYAYEKRMARMAMERGGHSIGTDDKNGTTEADFSNNLDVTHNSAMKVNPLSNHALEEIFARGGEVALDRALRLNDIPNANVSGTSVHSNQEYLRASLKSALMELASLRDEKKWFESSLEARVEKSIEIGCSLDEANDLIRSMQRNEKELDREMGDLRIELERKNSERTEIVKELKQNKGEVSCVKRLLAEMKVELSQSYKKNEELENSIELLRKELAVEQDTSLRAEVMLVKANGELVESKTKIDYIEEENEILKEDIAIIQDKSEECEGRLVEMKNELGVTKSILESLGKRVDSDNEELKNARENLIVAQKQICSLEKEVKKKERLCSEKDLTVSQLKSKLHQGQGELNSFKSKYQCSEKISEAIGQSLNEANERFKSLKRDFDTSKQKYIQDMDKLRTAFVQKDAEVVNRQFEISQYTRQKNKLEREIAGVKKEVEAAQSNFLAVLSELQKEKCTTDEKNTKIIHMQQQLEENEKKYAEIGLSLDQASGREHRANGVIHQLESELELVHKTQNDALLFIRNPCSSNKARRENENSCCLFPFLKKRTINIKTSSSQEAYEKLIICIEDALTNHRQELGLSQRSIDALLHCSAEDHYQDFDIDFDGELAYEINNGEIQMLNSAPLRPSYKELSRRMIFFYRESSECDDTAPSLPQPILDTINLRLVRNEISTSNCLECLQALGDNGIRDLLGRNDSSLVEPSYVAPALESLVPLKEGEPTRSPRNGPSESTIGEGNEIEPLLNKSDV